MALRVFLGWQATGLVDKGTFIVDEVEYGGLPDQITLRARSADMASLCARAMSAAFTTRPLTRSSPPSPRPTTCSPSSARRSPT